MDTIAYVDRARPGQENMDIDRQLLEAAERTGSAYVRLYQWSEPTLSLGHFQAGIDRNLHQASRDLPMVLRASGGGAIVHDHEWTYSIAMPVGRNKIGASKELYDVVHGALVDGLRGLGWDASQWTKPCVVDAAAAASIDTQSVASSTTSGDSQPDASSHKPIACGGSSSAEPLLCFQRRSCGDIVCEGWKVVGSAQRRLGGSVLQHGSILCRRSLFAPELPGLLDLPLRRRALAPVLAVDSTEMQATFPTVQHPNPFQADGDGSDLAKDSPFDMQTFGETVLSWVTLPLVEAFGCRIVSNDLMQLAKDGT